MKCYSKIGTLIASDVITDGSTLQLGISTTNNIKFKKS